MLSEGEDSYSVFRDCARLTRNSGRDETLAAIVASVNRRAIDELDRFAVHAGVVRIGDRIVAFPAESGGGKTTLTAALVARDFSYLSDEALILGEDGTVTPYPKPLALSAWSQKSLGVGDSDNEILLHAEDLGGDVGRGGRLTDLVIHEFGHSDVGIESLPRSNAVPALIGLSFNHYKNPGRSFEIVTDLARDLNVWSLRYGDPRTAAEELHSMMT